MDSKRRKTPSQTAAWLLGATLGGSLTLGAAALLERTEAIARADEKQLANPLEQRATMIELLRSIDQRLGKIEQQLAPAQK
jgi:hypothetical protein